MTCTRPSPDLHSVIHMNRVDDDSEHVRQIWSAYRELVYRIGYRIGYREGCLCAARSVIQRLGRKKFGPPTPAQEAAVAAITDLARLEALSEKLLDVTTWDELLANP